MVSRWPSASGTAGLVKKWMDLQLLGGYDHFVEHVVAHCFLHPEPFEPPQTPHVGFAAFLHRVSTYDWDQPLVVEFEGLGALGADERQHIHRSFTRPVKGYVFSNSEL